MKRIFALLLTVVLILPLAACGETNKSNNLADLDAELERAIAYGIDRTTIVDSVLKDGSVAAEGIIPFEFATSPAGTDYRDDAGTIGTTT